MKSIWENEKQAISAIRSLKEELEQLRTQVERETDLAVAAEIRYGQIPVRKVERFAINGDIVFINWQFEFDVAGVGKRLVDTVAMQTWDGDRIRRECLYFDPRQIRPST